MSEHGSDFVTSALNIPKYRFMIILLSAVSLFYLMSFYITKSQTEETLQENLYFDILIEASKFPAEVAENNKQWMGTCL